MKGFISTFFACICICSIVAFFFPNLLDNIWVMVVFVAFLLALFITVFMNTESRIEELEKKMEQLLSDKQD